MHASGRLVTSRGGAGVLVDLLSAVRKPRARLRHLRDDPALPCKVFKLLNLQAIPYHRLERTTHGLHPHGELLWQVHYLSRPLLHAVRKSTVHPSGLEAVAVVVKAHHSRKRTYLNSNMGGPVNDPA